MPSHPLPVGLYKLPTPIHKDPESQDLVVLHEEIIKRLRAESEHVPMSTLQELLLERIATTYIIIRWKERSQHDPFETSKAAESYNAFWLSMVREFNAQVRLTDADYKNGLISKVNEAINDALMQLPAEQAFTLRESMSEAFTAHGV